MTLQHVGLALLILSFGACSSTTTTPDTATPTDTNTTPTHTMTSSAKFDWSLPDTAPTRDASCEAPGTDTYGASYPWQGFTYAGTTYTCNRCPGGDPVIQGDWRAVFDENGEDPTVPYDKDPTYRELLSFSGNTFVMELEGKDLGANVRATISGWYFCSSKPETGNAAKFFIVTGAEPEGAFSYESGMVFTADLLSNELQTSLLFLGYGGVVTTGGGTHDFSAPYCKVGTTIGETPCEDPFK